MKKIKNKNIKELNTFGIDVTANSFVEFKCAEDLKELFKEDLKDEEWFVFGGGSNILFTSNYNGTLLHPINNKKTLIEKSADFVLVNIGAGCEWDNFVEWSVTNGYYGLENLSYIPGSVGASPVQNIGAYGSEAKDSIVEVEYFDVKDCLVKTITKEDCDFDYRHSIFKTTLKNRAIVLSVTYKLSLHFTPLLSYGGLKELFKESTKISAQELRDTIIDIRKKKLPEPKEIGNGGSFFKNPIISTTKFDHLKESYPNIPSYIAKEGVKIPAAWLIEQCGWKGRRIGDAGVHKNQALVLVNYGMATGSDIIEISKQIQIDVLNKFDIDIYPEINIL